MTKTHLSKRGVFVGEIAGHEPRGPYHWAMTLRFEGPDSLIIGAGQAGQFVQAACWDIDLHKLTTPLLRRPFSISGLSDNPCCLGLAGEKKEQTVYLQFIYRLLGEATQWLSRRKVGERLELLGPLGHGFKLSKGLQDKGLVLIGGGVGLPPLFYLADTLQARGCRHVTAIAGARDKDLLACQLVMPAGGKKGAPGIDELNRSGTRAIIATDDGSLGFKGNVVEALKELMSNDATYRTPVIFTCGPEGMLRAVAELAMERNLPCQVCLESYMACGIGVCQSCAVATHSKGKHADGQTQYKLVCSHGPVFDAREVAWGGVRPH